MAPPELTTSYSPAESLGIEGARAWSTKQLAAIALITLLLGLYFGYGQRDSPPPPSATPSAQPAGEARADGTETNAASGAGATADGGAAGATGTGDAPAGDGDEPSGSSPSAALGSAAGAAAPEVLLDVKPTSGPADTASFRVGPGGWKLGWAFDCARSGGTGPFEIQVLNPDGSDSTEPAVSQEGAAGKSVEAYATTGERILAVTTNCAWALKVTGIRG